MATVASEDQRHREGAWTPVTLGSIDVKEFDVQRRQTYVLEGIGLVVVSAVAGGIASLADVGTPVGIFVAVFGGFGLAARNRDDLKLKDIDRIREMRSEFGSGQAWIVQLAIHQGEAPTGSDEGLMWIEDDRLLFSGRRTSFALAPDQTKSGVRYEPTNGEYRFGLQILLSRRTELGELSISFWPIADKRRKAESEAESMRSEINRLLDAHRWTDDESILGQWPPTGIGANAPTPRRLRNELVIRLVFWATTALVLAIPVTLAYPVAGILFFLTIGILIGIGGRSIWTRRWKAYRDSQQAWRLDKR